MKKLISLFFLLPIFAYADIAHYNGSTVDVSKITGNWNSFNWNWAGSSTQTNQVTFKNGTSYFPLDDYVVYFRLARQSDTGQVNYLNVTNISKSLSNVNFRVEYTNVPPNGGYLAEFYVSEGDSTFRTIGQGKVQVYNSIYGDDDSTYPFPVSTNIYSYSIAGDVGGTMGATVVNKIHGYTMSNTVPAADDVWIFDGTNWVPTVADGIYTNLGTALATHEALTSGMHGITGQATDILTNGIAAATIGTVTGNLTGNADTATAVSEAQSNAFLLASTQYYPSNNPLAYMLQTDWANGTGMANTNAVDKANYGVYWGALYSGGLGYGVAGQLLTSTGLLEPTWADLALPAYVLTNNIPAATIGTVTGNLVGNASSADSATSAGYASGLASDVTNSILATAGGLTFNNATNATTLANQAAGYYLNGANFTNYPFSCALSYGVASNSTNEIVWWGNTQKACEITNLSWGCTLGTPILDLYTASNALPLSAKDYIATTGLICGANEAMSNLAVSISLTVGQRVGFVVTNGVATNMYMIISGHE